MRATYRTISSDAPPAPRMLTLPYEMSLTIIFARFNAPVYRLPSSDDGALPSYVELMQLHKHPGIPMPQP